MKPQVRVLGIDDAAFEFGDDRTRIIGVVTRSPAYVEGVMMSEITIDGMDSTDAIIKMVNASRYKRQLRLIMIDGAALGGFNVVDMSRVWKDTGIPVATITRYEPDFEEIEKALKSHFSDWEERLELMRTGNLAKLETDNKPIWVDSVGIEPDKLKETIANATVRGALPEAIRLAHLIGTAMVKGESHGRA